MGVWGTSLFSNDLALDVRSEYIALLGIGKSNEVAEKLLEEYYSDIFYNESEDEPIYWFSLAHTEWKKGRLSERTKLKALEFIDNGKNLNLWKKDKKSFKKREKVLNDLKAMLLMPMPEKKKIRKPTVHHCPWQVGSLLAYRIVTNEELKDDIMFMKYALLRVIKIDKHPVSNIVPTEMYDETMLVGLYGWCGDEIPDPEIVKNLKFIPISSEDGLNINPDIKEKLFKSLPVEHQSVLTPILHEISNRRIETCTQLDWLPFKERVGDITCIGYDESYKNKIPEYFKTGITQYSMTHFLPFDMSLAKRLRSYVQ